MLQLLNDRVSKQYLEKVWEKVWYFFIKTWDKSWSHFVNQYDDKIWQTDLFRFCCSYFFTLVWRWHRLRYMYITSEHIFSSHVDIFRITYGNKCLHWKELVRGRKKLPFSYIVSDILLWRTFLSVLILTLP